MKKLGLFNKKNLKNSLKFIFFFKIFPFIKDVNKIQYIKDIVNFYITDNEQKINYYKFIKYFIKNWCGVRIMSFESLTDEDIRFRIDNIIENFHKKLNSFIDCHKPKLSFFVSKYKSLIMTMYTEYINILNTINKEPRSKFSISDDIIEFLKSINNGKYNFNSILQINKSDDDILYSICLKVLNLLYENSFLNIDNDIKNNNNSINQSEKSDKSEVEAEEHEDNKDSFSDDKIDEEDFALENNLINFKKEIDNILKKNFKDNAKNDNLYNDYNIRKKPYKRTSVSNNNSIFDCLYGDEDLDYTEILDKKKKKK